jgi:hypothetical protein
MAMIATAKPLYISSNGKYSGSNTDIADDD